MSWMTEIADPATLRDRTVKGLAMPIGLANPLWLAFGAAASAGAAWWLMTRWARPFNAEALLAVVTAPATPALALVAELEPVAATAVPEAMAEAIVRDAPVSLFPEPPKPAEVSPASGGSAEAVATAPEPASAPEAEPAPAEALASAANEVIEAETALALEVVAETEDDLTRLVGIGPRTAAALAERGVTRFAHLAAWTDEQLAAFDAELKLKGRSLRDAWRAQAERLAGQE
jgi:predicted flap endonuclease-1-like 5' DNA nuclease